MSRVGEAGSRFSPERRRSAWWWRRASPPSRPETGIEAALLSSAVLSSRNNRSLRSDVAGLYRNRKRRRARAQYADGGLRHRQPGHGGALLAIGLLVTGSLGACRRLRLPVHIRLAFRLDPRQALQDRRLPHLARDLRSGDGPRAHATCAGSGRRARAAKWFAAYFISVWIATAALLVGQPSAFRLRRPRDDGCDGRHRAAACPDATP